MVKKLKKYKIHIRPSAVSRLLKKKLNSDVPADSFEKEAQVEIPRAEAWVVPTALYETLSKKDSPASIANLWTQASQRALSVSLIAATIGPDMEREIESCRAANDDQRCALLECIAREALEQSAAFVGRLLAEEAKDESCEVSPLLPADPSTVGEVLNVLESHKAGVLLDGNGRIVPVFTKIAYCFWNPVSRSKK